MSFKSTAQEFLVVHEPELKDILQEESSVIPAERCEPMAEEHHEPEHLEVSENSPLEVEIMFEGDLPGAPHSPEPQIEVQEKPYIRTYCVFILLKMVRQIKNIVLLSDWNILPLFWKN